MSSLRLNEVTLLPLDDVTLEDAARRSSSGRLTRST